MAEPRNGTWNKVAMSVMAGITLLSAGWAAATSTACMEIKRIDVQGTQKMHDLDRRVSVLEYEVRGALLQLTRTMDEMKQDLKEHTAKVP